jgi:hypothetical protein
MTGSKPLENMKRNHAVSGKLVFLSISFFLLSQAARSNIKHLPGYYIDLKGDSVFCNIEFTDWNKTPKIIRAEVNNSV